MHFFQWLAAAVAAAAAAAGAAAPVEKPCIKSARFKKLLEVFLMDSTPFYTAEPQRVCHRKRGRGNANAAGDTVPAILSMHTFPHGALTRYTL